MNLSTWIRRLLLPEVPRVEAAVAHRPVAPVECLRVATARPVAAVPTHPRPRGSSVGHLDREFDDAPAPDAAQAALFERISAKLESGRFGMPLLPPTSVAALALVKSATVEIRELAEVLEKDPLLTSAMLRVANSALYATQEPAATLRQAVMRIGLRSVRGVVFTAALENNLVRGSALTEYAEETWRQAQSAARLARGLGSALGFDPEQAHVIGLLHDIGKIALLGVLQKEARAGVELSPALVGRVFRAFHERAGSEMALAWKLPEEVLAIAGCHHAFQANATQPRGAALAYLVHEIDLRLSLADEARWRALVESEAFAVLETPYETRLEVLADARHLWQAAEDTPAIQG